MEASISYDEVNLRLQPKQAVAFESPATEILYGGAKYGGKSHLMRAAFIYWCSAIDGLQCYLFRRTFPDLWRNHMDGPGSLQELLRPLVRQGYAGYNGGKNYWEFWNGSKIHLCHCQYDKDKENYQGAEIHVLAIDQLEQWTRDVYKFLRAQVRLGGLPLPDEYIGRFPRILNGANPGGVGHNWVKNDFVDIAPEFAITRMPKEEGGMLRQYIPARLEDNRIGRELDPNYEDRLHVGGPAMYKALRWGIWNIVAGGAFDDLWSPEVHILRPFDIPKTWTVRRSLDWGTSSPFSVGWWARADGSQVMTHRGLKTFPAGTMIRVAEYYGWNGRDRSVGCMLQPAEVARRILEIETNLPYRSQIRPGPADSSIYDSDSPIAEDMARVGIRWTMADKRPGSRPAGLTRMRSMLKASLVIDPATGQPVVKNGAFVQKSPMEESGLFVFDTCQHFISTVPALVRDEKNLEDVLKCDTDHVYDESRYAIMTPVQVASVTQAAR